MTDNEDHAISLAELLGRKLKGSRPFLDSINHNGARIIEKMPDVLDEVNEKVTDFKKKVSGVFSRVMDTFQRVMGRFRLAFLCNGLKKTKCVWGACKYTLLIELVTYDDLFSVTQRQKLSSIN